MFVTAVTVFLRNAAWCDRGDAAFLNRSNRVASRSRSGGPRSGSAYRSAFRRSGDPLEPEFEEQAMMGFEQPVGNMVWEIGVDPHQVSIESRMADLG